MEQHSQKFLVIDEETPLRAELINLLAGPERSVVTSDNYQEALEILKTEQIDCMMIGSRSSSQETLDLISQVRTIHQAKKVPVILLSSFYRSPTFADFIATLPRARYLVRPFPPNELFDTLEELFSSNFLN